MLVDEEPSSAVADLALAQAPSAVPDVSYRGRFVLGMLVIAGIGAIHGSVAAALGAAALFTLVSAAGHLDLRAATAERSRWAAFVVLAAACFLLVALPFTWSQP